GGRLAAPGQAQPPRGTPPPLAAGWAVVSSDGGHEGGDVLFGLDPKAKTDFAYHSMDVAAVTAKALIADYYGQGPRRSYFAGCSNGGRPGMMFSPRFPSDFDGIIAGPATDRPPASSPDPPRGPRRVSPSRPRA